MQVLSVVDESKGEYQMAWYTNKRGARTVKVFKQYCVTSINIEPAALVHVFPALNGKKLTEGTLPKVAAKAMAAVVLAGRDAKDNGQCSCVACEEERDTYGFVSCELCGFMFHLECAHPAVEDGQEGDWWCQGCRESESSVEQGQLSV